MHDTATKTGQTDVSTPYYGSSEVVTYTPSSHRNPTPEADKCDKPLYKCATKDLTSGPFFTPTPDPPTRRRRIPIVVGGGGGEGIPPVAPGVPPPPALRRHRRVPLQRRLVHRPGQGKGGGGCSVRPLSVGGSLRGRGEELGGGAQERREMRNNTKLVKKLESGPWSS